MIADDGAPLPDGHAYYVLRYAYVADMVERRAPHRENHLAYVHAAIAEGRIPVAGALGDPPVGAVLVLVAEGAEEVERFADGDPYHAAGLITERQVDRWMVVI